MVMPNSIYLYHQELPWQCCKAKEVYQTTYITSNYHGNAVKLKKSIRLPISPTITMASVKLTRTTYTRNYHGNAVKLKKSIRLPISPGITMAML